MWDASHQCVRACACAHMRVNLGLIIKALLLADAQTGWQTSRQADRTFQRWLFLSFLLRPDILSPFSRQLILIRCLFAATFFAFPNARIFGSARPACDGSLKAAASIDEVSDLLGVRPRRHGDAVATKG